MVHIIALDNTIVTGDQHVPVITRRETAGYLRQQSAVELKRRDERALQTVVEPCRAGINTRRTLFRDHAGEACRITPGVEQRASSQLRDQSDIAGVGEGEAKRRPDQLRTTDQLKSSISSIFCV